ncbi:uncharacterized protein LOC136061807 [Quercus suber]|uniref:uncharacterized protein LOC136061807 n=1 Tax=Quercus suber TaxID=58331 RepID=UPI0032DE8C7E
MREGESLKAYSDRYWEMFNDMEGNFDAMALDTFKLGLPTDHGLRTSLSGKPVTNMRQLMDRIEKYKRVEEDQQQGKGKDKVIPQDRKDFRSDRYNNNKPRRDFAGQSGSANAQAVYTLVREGRLRHLLHHFSGREGQVNFESEKRDSTKPPLGTINVIFTAPGRTGSWPSKVMSVARIPAGDIGRDLRSSRQAIPPVLGFSDEDKAGTIQPHDDALVVTLRIGEYDVKRVMVDQGSAVEIMYPDLFKGLNLRLDDLTPYCSPLVSFEGRMVIPKG